MLFIEPKERAPRSSRPRWMRCCSDKVKTTHDGRRYIAEIGWELKHENSMYTTCIKFTEVKTTWRR